MGLTADKKQESEYKNLLGAFLVLNDRVTERGEGDISCLLIHSPGDRCAPACSQEPGPPSAFSLLAARAQALGSADFLSV